MENLAIALDELIGILDMELSQYSELIRLLRAQREQFTAGDIIAFEETSKQQDTIILKIKTLEEGRKSTVSRIAQCFGISSEDFTLSKLANIVDSPYKEKCMICREEILSIIKELENSRESNVYLIQHALHFVSGVLKIFASAHSADFEYSNEGQIEHKIEKGRYISGWG